MQSRGYFYGPPEYAEYALDNNRGARAADPARSGSGSNARAGRRLGRHFRLDLIGGAALDGQITIEDRNARYIGETGYDTAPFVGLTLQGKF